MLLSAARGFFDPEEEAAVLSLGVFGWFVARGLFGSLMAQLSAPQQTVARLTDADGRGFQPEVRLGPGQGYDA